MNLSNKNLAFGGLALVAIGSVGPWATLTAAFISLTVNGTDGDGTIFLVVAAGLAALVWKLFGQKAISIATAVGGVAFAAYGLWKISDVASLADADDMVNVSTGWGLYALTAGGIALVIAGIQELRGSQAIGSTSQRTGTAPNESPRSQESLETESGGPADDENKWSSPRA